MKCACSFTPVLALVGLVGLGVGGYNMMSTGCPLGTCRETTTATASVVSTSDTPTMDCCAGMGKAECAESMANCDANKGAAVTTVANTEKAAEGCAMECSTKACEDKMAKGECPHAVKTTDGTQTCPMHPDANKVAAKDKSPK